MRDKASPASSSPGISRRTLLGTAVIGSAFVGIGFPALGFAQGTPATASGLPVVADVHCHIFNVRDIPGTSFAMNVFLRESGILTDKLVRESVQTIAGSNSPELVRKILFQLVSFVDQELRAASPSIEDDIAKLKQMIAAGQVMDYTFSNASFEEGDRRLLTELLAMMAGHGAPHGPYPAPKWISDARNNEGIGKRIALAVKAANILFIQDPANEELLEIIIRYFHEDHPDDTTARSVGRTGCCSWMSSARCPETR
jgi:hypothetical protein